MEKPNSQPLKVFFTILGILILITALSFIYIKMHGGNMRGETTFPYDDNDPNYMPEVTALDADNPLLITKKDQGLYVVPHEIANFATDEKDPQFDASLGYAVEQVADQFAIQDFKNNSFRFCMESMTTNYHSCGIDGIATKSQDSNAYIFEEPANDQFPPAEGASEPCRLSIKKVLDEKGDAFFLFEEKSGGCWKYCGARNSLEGATFATSTRQKKGTTGFCPFNEN